jgi:hypothetical protein
VAVEKQLKDQGVGPASKTGRAATSKAKRANQSVEQEAADKVRESERKEAKRANWSVEQEAAYKVRDPERKKAAYWAKKNSQGRGHKTRIWMTQPPPKHLRYKKKRGAAHTECFYKPKRD